MKMMVVMEQEHLWEEYEPVFHHSRECERLWGEIGLVKGLG